MKQLQLKNRRAARVPVVVVTLAMSAWLAALVLPRLVADVPAVAQAPAVPADSDADAKPPAAARSKLKPNTGTRLLELTPERESAATAFVQQHHPQLAELLGHLKRSSPREFERAMRELFRTSERLAQIQERDSRSYELELEQWKARSRAQLLAARIHMGGDEELQNQLRKSLTEEYDLRLQVLQRERERLWERMKGLDGQLERLQQRRDQTIEQQFEAMTKPARAAGGKPANRKAVKPLETRP